MSFFGTSAKMSAEVDSGRVSFLRPQTRVYRLIIACAKKNCSSRSPWWSICNRPAAIARHRVNRPKIVRYNFFLFHSFFFVRLIVIHDVCRKCRESKKRARSLGAEQCSSRTQEHRTQTPAYIKAGFCGRFRISPSRASIYAAFLRAVEFRAWIQKLGLCVSSCIWENWPVDGHAIVASSQPRRLLYLALNRASVNVIFAAGY